MNREKILDSAKEIVTKDRQATHGNAEDNFATIAKMWEAYISAACVNGENLDICVTAEDVAAMMILMKVARISANSQHLDNWLDAVGYAACGGEIATKKTPAIEHIGSNSIVLLRNEEIKPGGSENDD